MFEGIFFVALSLLIWFETDAFNEYCKLLKIKGFYIDQYNSILNDGADLSYPDFLKEFHPSFLTRLLSCPICLAVWLGVFTSFFTGFSCLGVISLLGLITYKITAKLLSYA